MHAGDDARGVLLDRTITRKVIPYQGRYHHVANIVDASDLDDALCELLTESYADAAVG